MSKKGENILLGISIGDMNGIGPEVVLKSLEDQRMMEFCTPVIFANLKLVSFLKKMLKCTNNFHGIDSIEQVQLGKINVLNVWREGVNIEVGTLDENVGKYAIRSFREATKHLKEGKIDVLVTAPINKYSVQSEEFSFPGHTDYLNQELDGDALMLMVHNGLRIGLFTDHVPLSEVSEKITSELLVQKIQTVHQSLIQDFNILKPKIAVLGLNPHCGDNGVIGKEDQEVVSTVVEDLFSKGVLVAGPYAADGFFGSEMYKNFDAIIACYHDQGLIPFKTLAFGKGVNYTAGLNKIRTSPDHGTAFDIAGKGIADFESFREAIYLALDVYKNRCEYEESVKNAMKKKTDLLENEKKEVSRNREQFLE